MASQEIKHRPKQKEEKEQPKVIDTTTTTTTTTPADASDMNSRKQKRTGMARRGLRSLALATAFPLFLTILDIFFFGSSTRYRTIQKPFYFPPLWALHLAFTVTAFLSGLSAWLVWAEGGFHRNPTALFLYLGQLALGLGWYPIVFGAGATKVGLISCAILFVSLIVCSRIFKNINPIAGDLFKPCLGWALLLAVVNFRLVYQY